MDPAQGAASVPSDTGGEAGLKDLAVRAFVYGFPLVYNLEQVARYISTGMGSNPPAPLNSFSHARTLAGSADRFVTINNDTVYSVAQLDLSAGPLVLEVPDTDGRYYVLQLVSAWTDNFAYVGARATGTGAGRFLLVPPGWDGDVPDDALVIRVPTVVASINGRWAVDGDADLPAVHALQDATTLTPLETQPAPLAGLPTRGVPEGADPVLGFWERYRLASRALPPAERDAPEQQSFAPLGLTGTVPVDQLAPEVAAALRHGHEAGMTLLHQALRGGPVQEINGWLITLHVFDYNLDHFEIGTLRDPAWMIDDPEDRLLIRAGAALGGLWGNHAYEAAYLATYVNDRGEQLTGEREYTLTLAPTPPNSAFWSLTMYDVPDYFLVENPIGRYSIGDRTPGLVHSGTGELTIHLGSRAPADPAARANWLPAPPGPFRPMLRVYAPDQDVLDSTWTPPAIHRLQPEG